MTAKLLHGDVLDVLPTLEADSFDAMLTDPPYHLTTGKRGGTGEASVNLSHPAGRARISTGFMGQRWDGGDIAFRPDVWRECLRVLKPGAFALVFGGTRTFHRLAVALEDAGFELRDTLMWVYGSGFPKSHDVSKAIDKAAGADREVVGVRTYADGTTGHFSRAGVYGAVNAGSPKLETAPATPEAARWEGYGTALKPAWEPVLLVRKPSPLTFAEGALEYGCGALNIDGARVPTDEALQGSTRRDDIRGVSYGLGRKEGGRPEDIPTYAQHSAGRWPANLIHDGSEEVTARFPEQSSGGTPLRRYADKFRTTYGAFHGGDVESRRGRSSGNAARFFYSTKASTKERNAGLEGRNPHPTVKPLALTRYLATLLLPPERDTPRRLLVPFAGSGSEMIGARQAGWDEVVGIEREAEYVAIAEARLAHWTKGIQLGLACLEAV